MGGLCNKLYIDEQTEYQRSNRYENSSKEFEQEAHQRALDLHKECIELWEKDRMIIKEY